ncbi:hypothetical protein D3C83_172730 [compost metagenome]
MATDGNPLIASPWKTRKKTRVLKSGVNAVAIPAKDANNKDTPMIFFRPQALEKTVRINIPTASEKVASETDKLA